MFNNLLKLGFLNISTLILISLIVWTTISYVEGEPVNLINLILIILIIPLVLYLAKDVLEIYKNLKN
ncbi:MAG: hypothetical protein CMG06_02860 [Candidatus Marinimicrobia bacterium]|nr:hypothetical protein [Candidatus Neomarinimicrobiota bacterium]MAV96072.1 hypothetical protein [Candidatus Neomarinimicrobiota bacterium]|tara:strand:- start:1918 stop:2118 length:201 start_codon:yes stop_codon:yes gene_type:complete